MKTSPSRVERLRNELARDRLEERARIDAVIAEFGGDTDAPVALAHMAEAILRYRHCLRQFVDAGEMIAQGKPFIVMGPGPYWRPDERKSVR
jgi:hypothetical protein